MEVAHAMPPDPRNLRRPQRLAYQVADRLSEADLAARLRSALAGVDPRDAAPPTRGTLPAAPVVWEDAGDAVLVHLDTAKVRLVDRIAAVSVDFEADQTGRGPVIVRLVFGNGDEAELIASTDDVAHGHAALAARWGPILRDVAWAVLVGTAEAHAKERGLAAQAIRVTRGQVRLEGTADISLADRLGKLPRPPVADPRPAPTSAPRPRGRRR